MKTYDIWKMIDEDYESVAGEKIKLVKMPQAIEKVSIGDIASIGKNGNDIPCLFDDWGWRIKDLTGFEEWEEVKEPISFIDTLKITKENKGALITIKNPEYDVYYEKWPLDSLLNELSEHLATNKLAEILLMSEFYID